MFSLVPMSHLCLFFIPPHRCPSHSMLFSYIQLWKRNLSCFVPFTSIQNSYKSKSSNIKWLDVYIKTNKYIKHWINNLNNKMWPNLLNIFLFETYRKCQLSELKVIQFQMLCPLAITIIEISSNEAPIKRHRFHAWRAPNSIGTQTEHWPRCGRTSSVPSTFYASMKRCLSSSARLGCCSMCRDRFVISSRTWITAM